MKFYTCNFMVEIRAKDEGKTYNILVWKFIFLKYDRKFSILPKSHIYIYSNLLIDWPYVMVRMWHLKHLIRSIGPQDQEAQSLDDNSTVTCEMRILYCMTYWDCFCLPLSHASNFTWEIHPLWIHSTYMLQYIIKIPSWMFWTSASSVHVIKIIIIEVVCCRLALGLSLSVLKSIRQPVHGRV